MALIQSIFESRHGNVGPSASFLFWGASRLPWVSHFCAYWQDITSPVSRFLWGSTLAFCFSVAPSLLIKLLYLIWYKCFVSSLLLLLSPFPLVSSLLQTCDCVGLFLGTALFSFNSAFMLFQQSCWQKLHYFLLTFFSSFKYEYYDFQPEVGKGLWNLVSIYVGSFNMTFQLLSFLFDEKIFDIVDGELTGMRTCQSWLAVAFNLSHTCSETQTWLGYFFFKPWHELAIWNNLELAGAVQIGLLEDRERANMPFGVMLRSKWHFNLSWPSGSFEHIPCSLTEG